MSLSSIERFFARAEQALSFVGLLIASLALIASLTMVVVGVVGRYLLRTGVVFVDEYVGYSLVVMAFMGLAGALTAGRHIRIDAAIRLLPNRAQNWLEVAMGIVGLGIALFVTVQTWDRTVTSYQMGIVSVSPLETPLFLPQLFIPAGFVLFDVSLAAYVCRRLRIALTNPRDPSNP